MGNTRSGKRGGARCTDGMRGLDVRRIQQERMLKPGLAFKWDWIQRGETTASIYISVGTDEVTFSYQQRWRGGEWQSCTNAVMLTWTPCHYGGQRAWWLCPSCAGRVAILYSGKGAYACRQCHGLTYRSQSETAEDLAIRRAGKLRKRLGWDAGIANRPGGKPKGMHWRTYHRLESQHNHHAGQALAGLAAKLPSHSHLR